MARRRVKHEKNQNRTEKAVREQNWGKINAWVLLQH